jgi:hypothetical protein
MRPLRALIVAAIALLALMPPARALADAVDACPPGFQPSHSGCQFDPGIGDVIVCAACCGGIVLGAALIAILVIRSKRENSSREP